MDKIMNAAQLSPTACDYQGQDYIVISKKKVTVPDVSVEYLTDTIKMKMAEEEILIMSNADYGKTN